MRIDCKGWVAAALLLATTARAQVTFTDVTVPAGVDNPVDVQGVAWADADGDGDLDVYLTLLLSQIIDSGKRLYVNNGNGTFTRNEDAAGVNDDQTGFGACFADFDEDGDDDLALANGLVDLVFLANAFRLFENDGAGVFTNLGATPPLDQPGSGRSVTWADHDNDGDLDIFLVTPGLEDQYLFDNLGGGSFANVTGPVGLNKPAPTNTANGSAWADYDLDGDLDVFVAYGGVPFLPNENRLFRNDGGTFTNVTAAPLTVSEYSNGAAWGDCDNDGDFDLYVANSGDPPLFGPLSAPNQLFRNDGGSFTDISAAAGVVDSNHVSFSVAWGDFDNDGLLDLYVTNSPLNSSDPANRLFRNVGNCTFEDFADQAGVKDSGSGQGTALADYDGDGDLDIFVANIVSDTGITAHLYRNDSPAQNWLVVDTEGTVSNRDGVGARLVLRSGSLVQTRQVYAGSGYISQDSYDVEFGLGRLTSAEDLTIYWPSGCVQVVPNPPLNARLVIIEDCLPGFDAVSAVEDPCTTGVDLSWEAAAFASGTGHYEVRRGTTCADAGRQPELLPRPTGTTFTDATTLAGETWTYQVLAVDDVNGTFTWQCAGPITDVQGAGFTTAGEALPDPACVGEPVTFTATEPPGATFEWDFDGDTTIDATGPVAITSFATTGSKSVRLTATGAGGCVASAEVTVEVVDAATFVDPASPRVRRLGDLDAPVELSWGVLAGGLLFDVFESVDDASPYGGPPGPGAAPRLTGLSGVLTFTRTLPLTTGSCAYWQVHGASCP